MVVVDVSRPLPDVDPEAFETWPSRSVTVPPSVVMAPPELRFESNQEVVDMGDDTVEAEGAPTVKDARVIRVGFEVGFKICWVETSAPVELDATEAEDVEAARLGFRGRNPSVA